MDFYLIDATGGGMLHLPVNPGEVIINREKMFETVNILNLGEVDFTTGEKLKEIGFSSFFPRDYESSYCRYADIPDPQQAMNQLTYWTADPRPVRLIITETLINALVTVTAHVSQFKGGEPGDVYYDLTMRTWRQVRVRTAPLVAAGIAGSEMRPSIESVADGDSRGVRPNLHESAKSYTVTEGDSLWSIAKLELGDSSRAMDIYELNESVIGANPALIRPGQVLTLPPL